MLSLALITLLWAFSFSLIGVYLAADVDAYIAVFIRMLLATLLLLPFFRWRNLSFSYALKLTCIGAVQIGVMYILLYHSFIYLSVAEVLLFTIFTPLYITLIDEWLINRKPIPRRWWLAVVLSVIGAAIIRYEQVDTGFVTGFLLIQGANLAFAAGQVAYKRIATTNAHAQIAHYALFFFRCADCKRGRYTAFCGLESPAQFDHPMGCFNMVRGDCFGRGLPGLEYGK